MDGTTPSPALVALRMSSAGLLLLILASLGQVTFEQIDGTSVSGEWTRADRELVTVLVDGEARTLKVDQISRIRRDAASQSTAPGYAGLNDGCVLRFSQILMQDDSATFSLAGYGSDLKVPVKSIRWVRFQAPRIEEINKQWDQIAAGSRASDLLVVRTQAGGLDQAPGTIQGISPEAVAFVLGNQEVQAPRDRLEGLFFRQIADERLPSSTRITDMAGSTWCAKSFEGRGDEIAFETESGIARSLSLDMIHRMEFRGNVELVRINEAAELRYRPFLNNLVDGKYAKSMFGPRESNAGILLASGSSFEVRIGSDFAFFEAIIERGSETGRAGVIQFSINLDGESALSKTLKLADLPEAVKVPVDGRRRLEIRIDPGNDGSTGDTVFLRQPRLRK